MRLPAFGRCVAAMSVLAFSAEAHATIQVDFTGTTHAGSTAVTAGLPISGSFSFDETAAVAGFSDANTANFTAPGSAQFTVDGQTRTYTLTDIFLNSTGAIVFGFANGPDSLTILEFTSNTNLSSPPAAGLLTGLFFLNAFTPAPGTVCPPDGDGPNQILAEVRPSVPEPATWSMMLLGFAGIGFQLRRARKATSASAA